MELEQRVVAHYSRGNLLAAMLEAVRAAGGDPDHPSEEALAELGEFHTRGREATAELGRALALAPGESVLDVGSGIGGPSRHLARAHGCHITGIDLTEEYCRTATALAERLGLADRVAYRHGSALAMPFADASFDAAYTQHVAMNIADKPRLYAEIARVLKPGGRFGLYDLLQGPGGEPHYPVPWARDAATSFLITPEALRDLLVQAGFAILSWRDTGAEVRAWLDELRAHQRRGEAVASPLPVLFGADFPNIARNLARNLEEGRVVPAEVICRRG
ncbi:class I SAM-dependent methyltransferase [Crenalkalicoccus roseus]|uniref:class I SAM-dependent methyltransferase n=1 Tax=Crenalkalicoccus roseus TaxID=1485588 RepID=UPI001958601D|nr:methyltransferase domain-containing protein [Crenalkalicoccus roseus]